MSNTVRGHLCGRVVALIAVLLACVDITLTLAAQARWDDVVRAAEKEGEVSVYATNSVGELTVIWDAFKKKFPKIKLNAVPISTTSEIVTKIMAERRASQYYPDVVLGAPGATYNSLHRGSPCSWARRRRQRKQIGALPAASQSVPWRKSLK